MAKKEMIKSFVLRVDAETMEAIEKWAADEFRSTNGQLQWIIAEALRKSGRMKKKKTIIKKERNRMIQLFLIVLYCFGSVKRASISIKQIIFLIFIGYFNPG